VSTRELLDAALLATALLIALGVLLIVGHGVAAWLGGLAYDGRARRAREALVEAVRRGGPDAGTVTALRGLPRERRLAAFEALAPNLAGPEREAVAAAARAVGMIDGAERDCRAWRWRRRVHAVRLLALLGGGEAVVPPLLRDPRPEVRAQAAEWAADHPTPEVIASLLELLGDPTPFTRYTVTDTLIRVGREAAEPLAAAIAGGAGPAALEVGARIADPRLADAARARFGDPDPRIRAWAARLLGAVGGEAHAAAVIGALEDPDGDVRAAAAIALGRLGHWPAAGPLAARLRDPVWRVRRDAASALRALGAPGALLLERALRDEDPFARDMARQTLDLPELALPA
jgi:HEAT repeats